MKKDYSDLPWPQFSLQQFGEGGGAGEGGSGGSGEGGAGGGTPAGGGAQAGGAGAAAPGGNNPAGGEPKVYDEAYVQRINREAADARNRAKQLEEELGAAKGKLSAKDQEELENKKKLDDLAQKVNDALGKAEADKKAANSRLISAELRRLAAEDGLVDPDLLKLLDRRGLEVNDEGEVVGLEEKWKSFKESKPNFFDKGKSKGARAVPPAGGTGNGGNDGPPGTDFMKADQKTVDEAWNKYGSRQMRTFS